MLILKRKHLEKILIGNNIVITLVETGRGWARIGVEAPETTPVHREEVAAKIAAAKREEVERVWGAVPIGEVRDGA